ncbi:uncharacterized protein LOC131164108 [Malania oleifera]|uniref:uncharacterized protein LOC131164108 n=1 Tax=Malania oleifera TaxID=397392 RepID=UPI0025AE4D4B|nr:uncharacterized protein LOC131164108 [Malania oleifera]
MAFYVDEEEVWKCPKHPSKRRRNGICPICLRDRLVSLCPNCANVRPCACSAATATSSSSSSSSSSSFSLIYGTGVGTTGRVSNLLDSEPALRRSRTVAAPFLRSRLGADKDAGERKNPPLPPISRRKSSFWSLFKPPKTKKPEGGAREAEARRNEVEEAESVRRMMRSRSVGVPVLSDSSSGDVRSKARGWYFPSPIKAFRQSKTSKVVQERSPLCRG